MTANSLLQLSRIDKENVKRKDLIVVSPEMLEVEEGFNVRGVNLSQDEYWSQEHVHEHVVNLACAYAAGDYVPPIVVKYNPDTQKAIIRDGHHRYRALMMAIEDGADIKSVAVMEFKGDESKQALLMLKSANSLELTAVEKAEIYHRLVSYGYSTQEIANMVGKGVDHVARILKVYDLPLAQKRAIQHGNLSVAKAVVSPNVVAKREQRKAVRRVSDAVVDFVKMVDAPEKTETHVIIKMPIALYENLKGVDDGNA